MPFSAQFWMFKSIVLRPAWLTEHKTGRERDAGTPPAGTVLVPSKEFLQ